MPDELPAITLLLERWREGDPTAIHDLTPLVYDHLKRIAARHLRGERTDLTLCATEVVHEAYQRLAGAGVDWQDRGHFYAVASRQMRQVLVDHARSRGRDKRGGDWQRVTLSGNDPGSAGSTADILAVQQALERLEAFDPRKARIVDLMVFGGLTAAESAAVLGISEPTLYRDWKVARAWLQQELRPGGR
jgi:RNA polymerase sigma factor (TIGR02999 family)